MQAINIHIFGHVQGVGFRYSTQLIARKHHITGVVWNVSDGTVKIEAQGAEADIEHFVAAIKANPSPFARIDQVIVTAGTVDKNRRTFRTI